MATGRAQAEIISMQSVSQSTASTLKTTSGPPDWVIERVIMSSTEIGPTEGALWSRWGEGEKTPFLDVWGTERRGHSPGSWKKWEQSNVRSGLEPYKDDSRAQD